MYIYISPLTIARVLEKTPSEMVSPSAASFERRVSRRRPRLVRRWEKRDRSRERERERESNAGVDAAPDDAAVQGRLGCDPRGVSWQKRARLGGLCVCEKSFVPVHERACLFAQAWSERDTARRVRRSSSTTTMPSPTMEDVMDACVETADAPALRGVERLLERERERERERAPGFARRRRTALRAHSLCRERDLIHARVREEVPFTRRRGQWPVRRARNRASGSSSAPSQSSSAVQ